tara:strand:+ start:1316 stop:2194 length:879 start_codon:yes stop_codon:yes gene_type:complete
MNKILKCKVCDGIKVTLHSLENGYPIYLCSKCDLLFTVIKNASETWGHEDLVTEHLRSLNRYSKTHKFFAKLIFKLKKHSKTISHLDVGCAHGDFIKFCNMMGINSTGIDISHRSVSYAKKVLKLNNVFNEDLDGHLDRKKSYDVVTSFNVLEHVSDPKLFVSKLFKATSDNGYSIVRIPNSSFHKNINYLTNKLSIKALNKSVLAVTPPIHLSCFSKKNLKILFTNSGYKKITIKPSPLSNAPHADFKNKFFHKFFNLSIHIFVSFLSWTTYAISFGKIMIAPTIYVVAKK